MTRHALLHRMSQPCRASQHSGLRSAGYRPHSRTVGPASSHPQEYARGRSDENTHRHQGVLSSFPHCTIRSAPVSLCGCEYQAPGAVPQPGSLRPPLASPFAFLDTLVVPSTKAVNTSAMNGDSASDREIQELCWTRKNFRFARSRRAGCPPPVHRLLTWVSTCGSVGESIARFMSVHSPPVSSRAPHPEPSTGSGGCGRGLEVARATRGTTAWGSGPRSRRGRRWRASRRGRTRSSTRPSGSSASRRTGRAKSVHALPGRFGTDVADGPARRLSACRAA